MSKKVTKKVFVRVRVNKKEYRLNKCDIKCTHFQKKRILPPTPSYWMLPKNYVPDVENTTFYSMCFTKEDSLYDD